MAQIAWLLRTQVHTKQALLHAALVSPKLHGEWQLAPSDGHGAAKGSCNLGISQNGGLRDPMQGWILRIARGFKVSLLGRNSHLKAECYRSQNVDTLGDEIDPYHAPAHGKWATY